MVACFLPRSRRFLLFVAASLWLTLVSVTPRTASCQTTSREARGNLVETGKRLFDDQHYEQSIQTLSAALLRPATSKAELIEVYRYLAYNYLVLSQTEEAEAAVRGLYVLAPEFALADTESPRFRTFFDEVKKRWDKEGRPGLVKDTSTTLPSIKHVSPAEWENGQPIHVTGRILNPANRAASIIVRYRTGSKGAFQRLEAKLGQGRFRAAIPASVVKHPIVEYYIEVLDDAGLPIVSRGDAAAPMRIAISEPDQGSTVFTSPWFWVAAAVVVGGGVTSAILLSNDKSPQSGPNAPTSRVVVVIRD